MSAEPQPQADLGARRFAQNNRWFSWVGLLVGFCLVAGAIALGAKAARDFSSMASQPQSCAAQDCPLDQWVVVTDARWQCTTAIAVGPYVYPNIGIAEGQLPLLAAVDVRNDPPCFEVAKAPAKGVIKLARGTLAEKLGKPARVLWVGHGPANSGGLLAVALAFLLVGLFCIRFYREVLSAKPAVDEAKSAKI